MLEVTSQQWLELFSHPIAMAFLLYLLVGLVVAVIISFRVTKLPPTRMLRDSKDISLNNVFLFGLAVRTLPMGIFIWIALWPFLLLYLWASQDDLKR